MRYEMVMAILSALVLLAAQCEAGPFRRNVVRARYEGHGSTARFVSRGGNAQSHAEAMATAGSLVHAANHGAGYEGIGNGATPEAALSSCCDNGGSVVDQGVAYGNGRWWACKRYSR